MSNDSENFDSLQKVLKLKRHEVPPPGYFNHFSTKVISRIESEEEKAGAWGIEKAWVKKFFSLLETNPIAAGLFGVSVCGLLISGIAYSQYGSVAMASNGASMDVADGATDAGGSNWAKASRNVLSATSVNPMFSTNVPGSLFTAGNQLTAIPVNFSVSQ